MTKNVSISFFSNIINAMPLLDFKAFDASNPLETHSKDERNH